MGKIEKTVLRGCPFVACKWVSMLSVVSRNSYDVKPRRPNKGAEKWPNGPSWVAGAARLFDISVPLK